MISYGAKILVKWSNITIVDQGPMFKLRKKMKRKGSVSKRTEKKERNAANLQLSLRCDMLLTPQDSLILLFKGYLLMDLSH